MIEPTLQDQLEREQESINKGIRLYRERLKNTPIAEQSKGIRLMKNSIETLITAIESFRSTPQRGLSSRRTQEALNYLGLTNEQIAYITLKASFQCLLIDSMLASVCVQITQMLLDHHEYEKFKSENPGYLHILEEDLKSTSMQRKRTILMIKKRQLGILNTQMTQNDKFQVGQNLLDLVIIHTGLFEKYCLDTSKASDKRWYLRGTPETYQWLEDQDSICELMNPFWLPTIIKPKRWESPTIGGYYSDSVSVKCQFVRTYDKAASFKLWDYDMTKVYEAVNHIQETPWRVNKKVLEVLAEVWKAGSTLGGIPSAELEELPNRPWSTDEEFETLKATQPEVVQKWKWAATEVYTQRSKNKSKRANLITRIREAQDHLQYEKFYFPHNLDFRGRIYPIPTVGGLHPQGDDTGKALLEFYEGKALGDRGWYWLRVHGANTYGVDKVSFEDRIAWVKENHQNILDSAKHPLDYHWWSDADSPYMFLAFCFEYAEAFTHPESYVSHLPIAKDGSCNGLQNFSALLLDEVGGKAVNLLPGDKPQDIYGVVAQRVSDIVVKEALEGDDLARLWVGKVDRQMAKRNVMTLPYGAKKFGFKDQLMAELDKRDKNYLDTDDYYKPAIYLASRMYDGIGEVVIAARAAMDWLQEVASVVNRTEDGIIWTTPDGFPAIQRYNQKNLKRIDTFWGGIRITLSLTQDTKKLDKLRQRNGIAPNFVHSLDATHLRMTVLRLKASGITSIAMIHDSYGCLAADVDVMDAELRESFIEMYSQPILDNFRNEVASQIPDTLHGLIPEIPPKGTLDLTQVRHSKYFFA